MELKADFHCHTVYSDGSIQLTDLVNKAKQAGFSIVTKADHNTSKGNKRLENLARKHNLIFIPSVEISTKQGHLVGINIDNWDRKNGGKLMQDEIDFVLDEGGIPVIAHPHWRGSLGEKIFELKRAKGYELYNHSSPFGTARLLKENKKNPKKYHKFAQYSGSDAHGGAAYGHYYIKINCHDKSKDAILEALHKMQVTPFGPTLSENLILWWKDGAPNQIAQLHKLILKN
ncbi:MAG: hypothetical protein GF364_12200 [Candidatus Lokiarchaeota archaeon]|nr:hypothetical protein [Candidatus Lokiarchaeota archaeon]